MDIASCLLLMVLVVVERASDTSRGVIYMQTFGAGSKFALYNRRKVQWAEATSSCMFSDRKFAIVDSEPKQRLVESLTPGDDGFFWIGLKGRATEDKFVWADTSVVNYTNWAEGFPGKRDGLDCVRMRHFDFKWETFNCSTELYFLCEQRLVHKPYVVTTDTRVKGLALGFGIFGGLVVICCLVLQLPCCRIGLQRKVGNLVYGKQWQGGKGFSTVSPYR